MADELSVVVLVLSSHVASYLVGVLLERQRSKLALERVIQDVRDAAVTTEEIAIVAMVCTRARYLLEERLRSPRGRD